MPSIQVRPVASSRAGAPDTYRIRLRLGRGAKDTYRYSKGTEAEARTAAAAWLAEATQRGPAPASPATTLGAWLDQLLTLATHLEPRTRHNYDGLRRLHFDTIETPPPALSHTRRRHRFPAHRCWMTTAARSPCGTVSGSPNGRSARRPGCASFPPTRGPRCAPCAPASRTSWRPAGTQLRAVQHAASGRVGMLLRLALATGARRGELLALTWHHVDVATGDASGRVTIAGSLERDRTTGALRVKVPKTRSARRTLALPPAMISEIRSARIAAAEIALAAGRRVSELPVLPDEAGTGWWAPDAATMAAHRALREAGLPGITACAAPRPRHRAAPGAAQPARGAGPARPRQHQHHTRGLRPRHAGR